MRGLSLLTLLAVATADNMRGSAATEERISAIFADMMAEEPRKLDGHVDEFSYSFSFSQDFDATDAPYPMPTPSPTYLS